MRPLSGEEIAWAAQLACLYEVGAAKPGNVSRAAAFADTRYEHFVASAVAIGPAFAESPRATVGETIVRAVADTGRLVATNTNLGIVLLLAPLAKAVAEPGGGEGGLRPAVARVLRGLTVADAVQAYEAVRRAAPAGMGRVAEEDVESGAPGVTLRAAMDLARERDSVAAEYVNDYAVTFGLGCATLRRCWTQGDRLSGAIVTAFLTILAEVPDTLIARKHGREPAEEVSRRAAEVLAAGGCGTASGREAVARLDAELRDPGHGRNPGTTADLVCAALFVFLTEGGMLARVAELTDRW
ncbi:MAG: triphosphoribosyl-dephospho-CoA synthase [Thermoleophilia bacterium]